MTHRENVLRRLGLSLDKGYSLSALSRYAKVSHRVLQQVYNRGIGAYSSGGIGGNPSPSVRMKGTFKKGINAPASMKLSKEQWAMARVYSFLDGNPKHDNDLRA